MKIYTKTGDDGTTGLLSGKRVSKSSLRVEAYGTVDELNTIIGIVMSMDLNIELFTPLKTISNTLFELGSDLANPEYEEYNSRIKNSDIKFLENLIDEFTARLPELKNFILPGGSPKAAHLHHARAVCRRAERLTVDLGQREEINPLAIQYLNRLSDFLFTAARMANKLAGTPDVRWQKK